MKEKQKILALILFLLGNFTFLATAQSNKPTEDAMKLPECIKSHGVDSLETRKNMSLFQEDFKNKDYELAYKWWAYVYNNAPCSYKSIHQNGPVMLGKLIDNPALIARKKNFVDTLLMVFPTRIKYFGEEAFVKGIWAYSLSRYKPDNTIEIMGLYKFYHENEKDKLNEFYLRDYLRVAIAAHKKLQINNEALFNLYDNLSTTGELNREINKNDSVSYKEWSEYLNKIDKMMLPFLKGKDIDLIFLPKLKANPNDKVLINKAIKFYKADPLYKDNPNFIGLLEKSYALEPNTQAAESLARYFESKKSTAKANDYYEKAAELSTDNSKKEELYYKLAKNNIANLSTARGYANKVLALNPNNGNAIIIQGLAAYKNRCGSKFDMGAAACLAVDYFNRAKNIDPSCAAEANKQIANHKKFFPAKADAFFLGIKDGDSYTIPCSGESTTIRTLGGK
jgi:hypothetical protein